MHELYLERGSRLHDLDPAAKIAAVLVFVAAVVATPRTAWWAFLADATILLAVALVGALSIPLLLRRCVVELPFVLFAVLMPLVGHGPYVTVVGIDLSRPGLWAAWNIVAKGTLGVLAAVILSSTTAVADLLRGLQRLRVPSVLVAITGFMIRYATVVSGELHRMRVARVSRGANERWLWQARAVASSAGALFVRSYERGERVHLAMVSRGYDGTMPSLEPRRPSSRPSRSWACAIPSTCAIVAAVLGLVHG